MIVESKCLSVHSGAEIMAFCLLLLLLISRNDCIQDRHKNPLPERMERGDDQKLDRKLKDCWYLRRVQVGVSAPEAYSSTLYSLQYFRILRRGRQCINHVQKDPSQFNPRALYQGSVWEHELVRTNRQGSRQTCLDAETMSSPGGISLKCLSRVCKIRIRLFSCLVCLKTHQKSQMWHGSSWYRARDPTLKM